LQYWVRHFFKRTINDKQALLPISQSSALKQFLLSGTSVEIDTDILIRKKGQHKSNNDYVGKEFPTFFNIKRKPNDSGLYNKVAPKNRRARVLFLTDAENNYFGRDVDAGKINLTVNGKPVPDYSITLLNGIAALSISLPQNNRVGQGYQYQIEVSDPSRETPFIEEFQLLIGSPVTKNSPTKRKKAILEPPNVYEVDETEWKKYDMDEEAALKIMEASEGHYDFYINIKNKHLLSEVESSDNEKTEVIKAQFKFGMALIGLSIIQSLYMNDKAEADSIDINNQVYETTKMISPIFIPMLKSLSSLREEKQILV